jgi:uncharacterized membrane protein
MDAIANNCNQPRRSIRTITTSDQQHLIKDKNYRYTMVVVKIIATIVSTMNEMKQLLRLIVIAAIVVVIVVTVVVIVVIVVVVVTILVAIVTVAGFVVAIIQQPRVILHRDVFKTRFTRLALMILRRNVPDTVSTLGNKLRRV